jgi:cation transport ATPase
VNHDLVIAAFGDNVGTIKTVVVAFVVIAVVAYLGWKTVSGNHRAAWAAIPLVAFVLIIADPSALGYVKDLTLSVLKFFGGSV